MIKVKKSTARSVEYTNNYPTGNILESMFKGPEQTFRKWEKIGRNEICPCGSGKKYKNCCINSNIDWSTE